MAFCGNCGKENADGFRYCVWCGTDNTQWEDDTTKTEIKTETKKSSALLIAIAAAAVVLIGVIVFGILLIPKATKGKSTRDTADTEDAEERSEARSAERETAGGTAGEKDGVTNAEEAAPPTVTVRVTGANDTGALSGAVVYLKSGEFETSGTTDERGYAVFYELAAGEYEVSCDADGYNRQDTHIELSDGDLSPLLAMAPEIHGDDAMVLLTWNGEHDLDLCAFNADVKEYIHIGHPVDSAGNVILYADHGADEPYEVIYIHDVSDELARSIFVTEARNARNGEPSTMEADGVRIQVYNNTGLVYECEPSKAENAALWSPCYFYAGTVYEQGEYIYHTTEEQYAWISFDEKDAYTEEATAASAAAANAYLADTSGVVASEAEWKAAYLEIVRKGKDAIKEIYEARGESFYEYMLDYNGKIDYALLFINNDDVPELVLHYWLKNQGGDEEIQICTYRNGKATLVEPAWGGGEYLWGLKYYERKDYISYSRAGCTDRMIEEEFYGYSSGTDIYSPVFQSRNAIYDVWKYDYIDGHEEKEWQKNYNAITEAEYNRFVNGLGTPKSIEDECVSYEEMISLLGGVSADGWKQAYLDYLNNEYFQYDAIINFYEHDGYLSSPDEALFGGFIYINGDDIPEMVLKTGTGTNIVVSYFNGEVRSFAEPLNTYYSLGIESYLEKSGYFLYYDGGEGVCEADVVKLTNEGYQVIHSGGWADGGTERDFRYDGKDNISEEEFHRLLDRDYDSSNAKSGYGSMNYSQIVAYLTM